MKKMMCFLAFFLPGVALAAGGNVHLDKAPIDLTDKASLQRGAQLFMNYCGAAPPDLTLVARVRGEDWIYTYLRSFYVDESRPFGVNNTVFPEVGMPHVLLLMKSKWLMERWLSVM